METEDNAFPQKGKVLYLALEDKLRRIQERLMTILGNDPFPPELYLEENWPRLHEGGLEALDKWLEENSDCRFVVIDTLAKVRPPRKGNADLYGEDMRLGAALQDIAHRHGVALLVVHHVNKSLTNDPLEQVSGTTGMTGSADCILVLRRGRGQADGNLFVTGRDVPDQDLALKFDGERGKWKLLGEAKEFAVSRQRQKILQELKDNGPGTPTQIAQRMEKNTNNIRQLLWNMSNDGLILNDLGTYRLNNQ